MKLLEIPTSNAIYNQSKNLDNHNNIIINNGHHYNPIDNHFIITNDGIRQQNHTPNSIGTNRTLVYHPLIQENHYSEYQMQQHLDLEKSKIYGRRGGEYRNSLRISENSPSSSSQNSPNSNSPQTVITIADN